MEEATRQSQVFLQTVVDAIPDTMLVIDRNYHILMANHAARSIAGGMNITACLTCHKLSHHRDLPCEGKDHLCPLHEVIATKAPLTVTHTHYDAQGREIFVEVSAAPVFDEAGEVAMIIEFCRDVSERKRWENELERQHDLLRTLIDNLPDCIFVKDVQSRFIAANLAVAQMMGVSSPDDLLGKTNAEFYPAELAAEYLADEQELLRSGIPVLDQDEPHLDPHGDVRIMLTTKVPLKDRQGKIFGFVGISRDVTERRIAEEILHLTQFSVDHAGDPIFWIGPNAYVEYANLKACAHLGYSQEELLSLSVHDFDPHFQADVWPKHWEELKRRGAFTFESEHRTKDGRLIPVEITVNYLRFAGKEYNCAYVRDLTDRKRAEEALQESETRFRTLADAVPVLIWQCTPDKRCDYFNRSWLEFTGRTLKQEVGAGWAEGVHPEDRQRCWKSFASAVERREPFELEYRLRHHSGQYRWIFDRGVPRFAIDGSLLGYIGGCIDISDRKDAEEQLIAAKHSAEQANCAKDHFLAVLSHELRTPLTPVVMGLSLLQDRPDLDPAMRETLEMFRRNVEMEALLIDDLLDVTRIAHGKIELHKQQSNLCDVIQRAAEVCKPDIEARSLHFDIDWGTSAPYWIEADSTRLQQVFWNLLKNAVKFTPPGGCVGIRCRSNEQHVLVEVNDSGMGIEPESLLRIFNAFEQAGCSITRQFGGLGLGLAISRALVEMHGGKIEAYSEGRNKGATFRVSLSLADASQVEKSAPATPPLRVIRPLHILLVEDHGITAKILQMMLSAEGHTVARAGDLASALQLADNEPFDLLLSDLGLPDGSGQDLMRELRHRGYRFPGIALSGYGQEEEIQRSCQAGFAAHLIKPASRERVVETIASVIMRLGASNAAV